jgi:NAD(P)-dependent dehydrogenase (short-subunit alcohol dehydrogenase family)
MAQEMSGKVVLVTGGNAGIGKATAEELARRGANVTFIARRKNKAEAAKKEIIAASGNGNVDYILADLSEMKQVRAAAEEFKRRHAKLDVLVNNAGVWLPKRELTSEGNEKTFATIYLSHFLLTNLLVDRLKAAAPSRVVNVSSKLTKSVQIPFDDLTLEKGYSVMTAMPVTKPSMMSRGATAMSVSGGFFIDRIFPFCALIAQPERLSHLSRITGVFLLMPASYTRCTDSHRGMP